MQIVILANAPNLDLAPHLPLLKAADLVIAADGGALPLVRAGRRPDIVIGDMDSLDQVTLAGLAEQGAELRRYPREKDETDLELALLHAAALGATAIDVLGALGGRWPSWLAAQRACWPIAKRCSWCATRPCCMASLATRFR